VIACCTTYPSLGNLRVQVVLNSLVEVGCHPILLEEEVITVLLPLWHKPLGNHVQVRVNCDGVFHEKERDNKPSSFK
jgi:hypothetical protein